MALLTRAKMLLEKALAALCALARPAPGLAESKIGVGTPRSLQGRPATLFRALFRRFLDLWSLLGRGRLPRGATRASTPLRECEDLRLRLLAACGESRFSGIDRTDPLY